MSLPSKLRLLENKMSVFNPLHTYESLFPKTKPPRVRIDDVQVSCREAVRSEWSWMRFSGLSSSELNEIIYGGLLAR